MSGTAGANMLFQILDDGRMTGFAGPPGRLRECRRDHDRLAPRLRAHQIEIEFIDDAVDLLAREGYDRESREEAAQPEALGI